MNEIKHLLVTRVFRLRNAVELERLWGTSTALVEGRYKTFATSNFGLHVVIHIHAPFRLPVIVIAQLSATEIMVCQNARHLQDFAHERAAHCMAPCCFLAGVEY